MAWIRLSDDYVDDEKMQALTDGSFRLWHEALAHCRRHQTDGLIPFTVMRGLRSFTKTREKQLAMGCRSGVAPLWEVVPGMGYQVRNYLIWNPSKDEENGRRGEAKERMRILREDRREAKGMPPITGPPVPPNRIDSSHDVRANSERSSPNVLGMGRDLSTSDPESENLARKFFDRYPLIYQEVKRGTYQPKEARDFPTVMELVRQWPDLERLMNMAKLFLMKENWAPKNVPGTIGQFAHMAPECDSLLARHGR